MSKNTASIARAISLLSDVLSREAVAETETAEADPFDDGQEGELDELKHQALEFGQQVADDLDTISDELDRTLEANEFDDDDDWADDGGDLDDDDTDEELTETTTAADTDPEPSADSSSTEGSEEVEALQKTTAALEKSNEELTDKIDDLTEALQHIDTLIDDLNVTAKEFVSEVETL